MAKEVYESYVGWDYGYGPVNGHYDKTRTQNRETRFTAQPTSRTFAANHSAAMRDRTAYIVGLTGGMPDEVFSHDQ